MVVRPAVPPIRKPLPRESAKAHDHVSDALEAEHGVVHVEGNRRHLVGRVRLARGGERGHGAGLGDAFFEDLAVLLFAVEEQHVLIVRRVALALGRVDADLPDGGLQAEGAAFVGHDRHDELADGRVLHAGAQDGDEAHGGGDGATVGAGSPLLEELELGRLEVEIRARCAWAGSRRAPRGVRCMYTISGESGAGR